MATIPVSKDVTVLPNVINAGGNALDLIAMVLTKSTRVPTGTFRSFPNALAVGTFFGMTSPEYGFAVPYFAGFTGRTAVPGSILFVQYPATALAAYLQSGPIASLSLAELQAMSGTLTVVIDGYTHTASNLNLSGATSYSAVAALIQQGLDANEPTECTFTGAIAGTTLTVSAVASGTLSPGQTLAGTGVAAGTMITGYGTGSGLTGTYTVNNSQTVASEALTALATALTVSFDSVSGSILITSGITGAPSTAAYATGSLASSLLMTQATGAVLSQGEAYEDPVTFMNSVILLTQDWASFSHTFDPDGGTGNAMKLAFAQWTNSQNNRYAYVPWDTDVTPTESTSATSSLGALLKQNNYSGTIPVWESGNYGHAAFICGYAASLNFNQTNGRTTLKFRGQTGMIADVTDQTVAQNLEANGYNYYGAYATANQGFLYMSPGSVSGPFLWADSYYNQIWLNNELQLDLIELETQIGSIPYNAAGYTLIENACIDTIQAGLNFGAIRSGVTLSSEQIEIVNNYASGVDIATTLSAQGWYFLIQNPPAQTRVARSSPPIYFFYCDGGSVQQITLNSEEVQ